MISTTASAVRSANEAASATRRPCCRRSSAGPMSGAITANGAMVINRYSATLDLLSPLAAAKNSVLASATAIAASTAKFATTGQVGAVGGRGPLDHPVHAGTHFAAAHCRGAGDGDSFVGGRTAGRRAAGFGI